MSINGLNYIPNNRSINGTTGYSMGNASITSLNSGYVIYANSSKTLTSTLVSLTAINQLINNTFTSLTVSGNTVCDGTLQVLSTAITALVVKGAAIFESNLTVIGNLYVETSLYFKGTNTYITPNSELTFCSITNSSYFKTISFGVTNYSSLVAYNGYRFYGNDTTKNTDLCIIPGYKGSTITDDYITFAIDGPTTGTNYFTDNLEIGGATTLDGSLTLPTNYTTNATGTNYFVKVNSSTGAITYDTNTYSGGSGSYLALSGGTLSGALTLENAANALVMSSSTTSINANGTSVTATQLGYLNGVTANIQTQFGTYLPLSGGTLTGALTLPNSASSLVMGLTDSISCNSTTVSATQLGYLNGASSNIQTQINSRLKLSGGTLTGALTLPNSPSSLVMGSSDSISCNSTTVSATQVSYLSAMTGSFSSTYLAKAGGTMSGAITLPNSSGSIVMNTNDSIYCNSKYVTATQLSYVANLTNPINVQCWIQMYNPTASINHTSTYCQVTSATTSYSSGNNTTYLTTNGTAITYYTSTYDSTLNYYMSGGGYNTSTTFGSTYFSIVNSTTVGQPIQIQCIYTGTTCYVKLKANIDFYFASACALVCGFSNGTSAIYAINYNSTAGSDEIFAIETIVTITTNTTFSVNFAQYTGTAGNVAIAGLTFSAEVLA